MPKQTREEFLEECKQLALGETPEDKEGLKSLMQTKQGMILLGRLQLEWERKSIVGAVTINPLDIQRCAVQLAELQGNIRGILLAIDRLLGTSDSV